MHRIPADQFPRRDADTLCAFLEYCRKRAIDREHPQLASIALAIDYSDPLAVLQSVYASDERHFFLERNAAQESVAGADCVLGQAFGGSSRFVEAEKFCRQWLKETVAIGDLDRVYAGPHFFCSFTFAELSASATPFSGGYVFVPRWQVARSKGECVATANVVVDENTDVFPVAQRILQAHSKFASGDYGEARVVDHGKVRYEGGEDGYEALVEQALEDIEQAKYQKVVLARTVELAASQPFTPLESLHRLRSAYSSCYTFSFAGLNEVSLVGATPERLVMSDGEYFYTEALAGSTRRGGNAHEDARLAHALLSSEKDVHEHQLVVEAIERRLRRLGLNPIAAAKPGIFGLGNVQHLHTPIRAKQLKDISLLQVAAELHPTPAVGGSPRKAAVEAILRLENFDRGLYAGALGWWDWRGRGEFVVPLRSAEIRGYKARLFAGAGIVKGSCPHDEWKETELKLSAMRCALEGQG